ncbi:MAG: UMP kinase [Eubacteriales bacterium]|nr:UMP kinase [Eubacteriales bacterium]
MYKRVLLKLSGEALSSPGNTLDFTTIEQTALQIKEAAAMGVEIGIVVGGGNIWRGRSSGSMDRNRADHMGMLSTAINAIAMQDMLLSLDVPCTVLSAVEMQRFCDTFSARAADAALTSGKVVIFACGSGSPFFSTDTAAALRAAEIGADVLLLAKNIDAIYSADPKIDPNAVRYSHVSYREVIEQNLKATDITAITLCREQHIPIVAFGLKEPGSIVSAVSGKTAGTLIDGE